MKSKSIVIIALFLGFMIAVIGQTSNQNWPKTIKTTNGKILVYQPQLDSLVGITLYGRSAVSYTKTDGQPVFGAIWFKSPIDVDRVSRNVDMTSVNILNVRFPSQEQDNTSKIDKLRNRIETELPKWNLDLTMDELNASLKEARNIMGQAADLNTYPPEIIFTKTPSVLVLFDGDPLFRPVSNSMILKAVNTPFFIVQDPGDKYYYLFGDPFWYITDDPVNGYWKSIKDPPEKILKMEEEMKAESKNDLGDEDLSVVVDKSKSSNHAPTTPPQIIVRTRQAELIQSDGKPNFALIDGTQLLYMTNTEDNIFMFIDNQLYYVLISGRWYSSTALNGTWTYVPSDEIPADFANIPEGSDKDQVLASIAGTEAAREAVMDAQVPQTAAVYRNTATCNVAFDGDPKFVQIRGTDLYRGVNTSSTVILFDNTYYVCDNAVWFVGDSPAGPWYVATEIPFEIQNIPPDDPAYNVKYVYIYETTPEIVYVGYLPGYTGCYVYGPTVVYGTGYYYNPWYGAYYYPMPWTYGFHMHYNPWTGWGFGWDSYFWFMHYNYWGPHYYGWWGPPIYHPPFCPPYDHYYGPRPPMMRDNAMNIHNDYYKRPDIYNNHSAGVQPGMRNVRSSTLPDQNQRNTRTTTSTQPSKENVTKRAGTATNVKNNVYTDRNGEIYRQDQNNTWQRNTGKNWQTIERQSTTPTTEKKETSTRSGGQTPTKSDRKEPSVTPAQQPSQKQSQSSGQSFNRSSMDRQSQIRERSQQLNNNSKNFERNFSGSSSSGSSGTRQAVKSNVKTPTSTKEKK